MVIGIEHPWDVISKAGCDVDQANRLAQEALKVNGGQAAVSEEDFRSWVEFRRTVDTGPPREETDPPWPDSSGNVPFSLP